MLANGSQSELELRFPAVDGYSLGGRLFASGTPSDTRCAVLLVGGGGIPAAKYRHFARFLATQGLAVLLFDYRGIGWSRPSTLRGFDATVEKWAELDITGGIDELATRFPHTPLGCVAHSIGTMLLGAASNLTIIQRFIFLSPSTGNWSDYRPRHRIRMFVLWHLLMPLLAVVCGYFPGRRIGLIEDLPKKVALQWARSRTPEQWASSPAFRVTFSRARGELLAFASTDDGFSTESAIARVIALYPNLTGSLWMIDPDDLGEADIGHFGLLRRRREADFWPKVIEFLVR